ncbi:hypothetical protein JZ751_025033, partial [Albula glossodonta]
MQWFKLIYSNIIIWFHHCTAKDSVLTLQRRTFPYDESYYEYVPDRLQWQDAKQVCQQKSGALASVSSAFENVELTNFFHSLNITEPVWIEGIAMTHKIGAFESLVLEFSGRTNRKHARLLQQFPNMQSVTVCAHVQFDPSCYGFSTVFSYSIPSFINEFQLRANIIYGKLIQLALLVHGLHAPYTEAFENDGLWHFLCVSWTRDSGEWVVTADGKVVGKGHDLYPSADIGRDGLFIIGQEQDTFGGTFKSDESFSGNITRLNIWDRVLNISEIHALERECALISSGLFYNWNSSTLEAEPSLRRHRGISPCQETFENRPPISGFPKTSFFSKVGEDPLAKPVMEESNVNTTPEDYLLMLSNFVRVLLKVLEANPDILTPIDLLYLAQVIEMVAEAHLPAMGNSSEVILSFAADYLNLASELIDPGMGVQWLDLAKEGVVLGPFSVVQSIDKVSGTLADILSTEGKSFTLSTRNIELHLKPRKLSQQSCSCAFRPSAFGSQASSQDEILIPDAEVFRLHSLGLEIKMAGPVKWSPEEESVLTKLTFIGSGASLCALVVTLMLFTVLDIPKSDRMSIHKNLFIALTAAQIVLLCSGSAAGNKVACTLVAALLHLFFMAALSWMLVEGLLLWSKVVTVNLSEGRHMKYYYLIGWGLPVLIVTITLASAAGKYSAEGHCWLSVQNGVIWGFAGPVIFIMMVNIMVLTRVVIITISTAKRRSIMLAINSSPVEQAYEQIRAAVKAVLVLLPILGLTWLCGVLVPFSIVIAYIFILLNSLQVRSTINRIKERRRALNFSNCASSRPSSSVTSSRPASSPGPGLQGHSQEEGVDRPCASHLSSYSAPLDTASVLCESSAHASKSNYTSCICLLQSAPLGLNSGAEQGMDITYTGKILGLPLSRSGVWGAGQLSIPSIDGSQEDECSSPAAGVFPPK